MINAKSTRFSSLRADNSPCSFCAPSPLGLRLLVSLTFAARRCSTALLYHVFSARSSHSFRLSCAAPCTCAHWDLQHLSPPPLRSESRMPDNRSGSLRTSLAGYDLATTGTRAPEYLRRRHQCAHVHLPHLSKKVNGYDRERALAHLGGDIGVIGDGDEEAQVRLQCRYRSAGERERWSYRRRPPCACRWVLRMRMETEVRRWVWPYVLPIALALGPVSAPSSPSSSEAGFGFSFKALRYRMRTWARVTEGIFGTQGTRRHPSPPLTRSPSSCIAVYGCSDRMHTCTRDPDMIRADVRTRVGGDGDGKYGSGYGCASWRVRCLRCRLWDPQIEEGCTFEELVNMAEEERAGEQDREVNGGDDDSYVDKDPRPTRGEVLQASAILRRYVRESGDTFARQMETILGRFSRQTRL
ncbi:hypothetical protein B0H13DRAFT_2365260 [Mycena leptocephala]|nr:hypothetical protein B0H13DRAFT_2365260 [Mycena leptocephala]